MLICCATLCVTLTLFCVAALATDLKATVEPVDAKTVSVEEKTGGADRVFTVTKDSGVKAGDLYLVLIEKGLKATDKPKPTAEDIYYIDVWEATDSGLNRDATPRDMDAGSYAVFLSDWSDSGNGAAKGVATITLSAATPDPGDSTKPGDGGDSGDSTKPGDGGDSTTPSDPGDSTKPGDETKILYGDVDGNGKVKSWDATVLACYLAGQKEFQNINMQNADCDGNGKVKSWDLTILYCYLAGQKEFSELPDNPHKG